MFEADLSPLGAVPRAQGAVRLDVFADRLFGLGLGLTGSDVVYENTGSGTRIKVELRQTAFTINASLIF